MNLTNSPWRTDPLPLVPITLLPTQSQSQLLTRTGSYTDASKHSSHSLQVNTSFTIYELNSLDVQILLFLLFLFPLPLQLQSRIHAHDAADQIPIIIRTNPVRYHDTRTGGTNLELSGSLALFTVLDA